MKSLILTLLTIFAAGALAQEPCKTVKFGNHRMDLARPWPTEYLNDRHTQIQKIIGMGAGNFRRWCGQLDVDLKFTIIANGEFRLDEPSAEQSGQLGCYDRFLSQMRFGVNECGIDIPYKWNGKFPLVNMEAKRFP